MPKLPSISAKEAIKAFEKFGYRIARQMRIQIFCLSIFTCFVLGFNCISSDNLSYSSICFIDTEHIFSSTDTQKIKHELLIRKKKYDTELLVYVKSDSASGNFSSDSIYTRLSKYVQKGDERVLLIVNTTTKQVYVQNGKEKTYSNALTSYMNSSSTIHNGILKVIIGLSDKLIAGSENYNINQKTKEKPTKNYRRSKKSSGAGQYLLGLVIALGLLFLTRFIPALQGLPRDHSPGRGRIKMSKSCSNCGKTVSLLSKKGETCPHCGAFWSRED